MDYRQLILDAGRRMYRSGLTVETWGNISARDPETGLIYLTPSGMAYETLTREDVVVMNERMELVEGFRRPTVEAGMHIRIYGRRRDVHAVVHTHPIYSQVFAVLNEDLPPVTDEAAQVLAGTVRCAAYALPGTAELAENADRALGEGWACLLANHGAVCVGADMDAAFRVCAVLEMTAQITLLARAVGTPVVIDDGRVRAMRRFMLTGYGQPDGGK